MSIIVKPIITEKATKHSELLNHYGFVVDFNANKIQIKNAVQAVYGVNVVSVNTMKVRPNRSVKFTKSGVLSSRTTAYKKAFVQIQDGETIELYNNNM